MVEFALVAPLLFALVFGLIDFSRAFNYLNVEQQLANEGARLAAVNAKPGTCPGGAGPAASLQQYIQCQSTTKELASGGTFWLAKGAQVCITFPAGTSRFGDPVQVTVSVPYKWMPIDWGNSSPPAATTITGSGTMRLETAATNFASGCYQP
jgi:Flp pilus assembly protein TadG